MYIPINWLDLELYLNEKNILYYAMKCDNSNACHKLLTIDVVKNEYFYTTHGHSSLTLPM